MVKVQFGRLHLYLWAGSWNWSEQRIACDCCAWNFYIGPLGVELDPRETA